MAAASEGAALGGLRPNPSGDCPWLRSSPGKGKPVALADITNTGRPNATRSVALADMTKLVNENAKLIRLLNEKTKIIDLSRFEIQKLRLALQASRQQNLQFAQANSQMLAELNLGKDRLKALQHELSCTAAVLKVKDSELEQKNKTAYQRWKEVNSQKVIKAIPSEVAPVDTHQIDGLVNTAVRHQSVKSQSAVPSTAGCQEPPKDTITKRARNKRKSESSECIKDINIVQNHYGPHLQPTTPLDHEDPRKPVRRRSTRLNPGPCRGTEISHQKLHADEGKSLQNECSAIVHEVEMTSGFKEIEINERPWKEANLKEIQEACSSVSQIEARQIGDKTGNTNWSQLAETQSSLPFNVIEAPEAPEDLGNRRGTNKQQMELCKSGKDSAIEEINAPCNSSTSEPLRQEQKRKSQRRKSARLNSGLSEDTKGTIETLHEDIIPPTSSSNASMQQRTNQKQTDNCSSTKATEEQVTGRRSLRRAAEKVISYKEIPLNAKMRRP